MQTVSHAHATPSRPDLGLAGTPPLVAELLGLERLTWADRFAAIPNNHPRAEEPEGGAAGGDGSGGDGDGDGAAAGSGDGDGDGSGTGDGDGDGDGAGGDDELTKARSVIARQRRELKAAADAKAKENEKALADAGKFKELYETEKARREELENEVSTGAKRTLVAAALTKAKANNPGTAVKLVELDDVEDEADAERAVAALVKSDPYLFNGKPARQKKDAGKPQDEPDENPKTGAKPNRLRRGLEATSPK